jgi:type IV secretory pathway VirJ component
VPRIVRILIATLFFGGLELPGLIEVPADRAGGNAMAVLYTGDGGWRATDRGLATILAHHSIPVVALNTLPYCWTRRTPEGAAADFARMLAHYLAAWKKEKVVVIGYSFGADVLPFILSRLPPSAASHVELVALLSPTRSVDFEFHLIEWFTPYTPETARPVLPELLKLNNWKILTFCGDQDGQSLCRDLPPDTIETIRLHGGHQFDSHCEAIAQEILRRADNGRGSAPQP